MLAELCIIPLGRDASWRERLAEVLEIVEASGLAYHLGPAGTCIEGGWDEVMAVVRRCHERVRESSSHVVTTIKIEDEEGVNDQLTRNVASVEEIAGRAGGVKG